MSEQRAENRRRIGELAMAFMDDLEEEFEDAVLRDFLIIAEVEHGEEHPKAGAAGIDVTRRRYAVRYRCTSWRPLVAEALFCAGTKVVVASDGEDDEE